MAITFTITVSEQDWDRNIGGWRCSPLDIPGAVVDSAFTEGEQVQNNKYQILPNKHIKWIPKEHPGQLSLTITLTKKLSTQELTSRWKKAAIILPFIAAIISALLTYYIHTKKLDISNVPCPYKISAWFNNV